MYICIYMRISIHMHIYIYICIAMCVYIYIYTHMYMSVKKKRQRFLGSLRTSELLGTVVAKAKLWEVSELVNHGILAV